MSLPKDSLLLIDGHALLYRSFHALPPLTNKEGLPTNAIYGFITTLFRAFDELKPKYVAVAFDVAGPTFRHKAFAGYKASRAETPPDLITQVPYAYEVVKALNIPIFIKEGFEADDIIGTLATQAKKDKVPVVIVTGDKDSFQLVDDSTFVYTIKRSITETVLYDAQGVKERMGVDPEQIPDYKALAGDSSDEIPGISGIGDKTAVTILKHAKSIENLYTLIHEQKEIPDISPRIYQKIVDGEAIAKQSLELATIDRNVDVKLNINECIIHDYDPKKVVALFEKLEFFSLIKRLPAAAAEAEKKHESQRTWAYRKLTTEAEIQKAVDTLREAKIVAFDTETDNLYGPVIGVSFASEENEGVYIPMVREHGTTLEKTHILELLRPVLEDENVEKVGHHAKYDMRVLHKEGIKVAPVTFDTMVAAYILHAHLRTFDLDSVSQRELQYTPIPLSQVTGTTKKTFNILEADSDKLAEYAAEDAIVTYRLYQHFEKQLKKEKTLYVLAKDVDFPLIPVLEAMENRGVCIDKDQLHTLAKKLETEINKITQTIESHVKRPININSPAQLQKLLFEDLGLEKSGIKTTQTGISTAASELEKLQGLHPIIDEILRYRELTKLLSTYVKTLPDLAQEDGRLHTVFSQTTAATGRLASNDPNLQNIPVRSEAGNEIRKAFIAPKGYDLVSLDYSQFELRIIAHLSGDKALQKVFLDNRDIHQEVAQTLGIDRRAAKAINFGIIYGLSAYGLSQGLKIDPKTAKQYIDAYFATYQGLAKYLANTKQEIRDKGYVETLFGRRREIPEIYASNAIVRASAERMAINAPAQGTEADLIKMAMTKAHDWLEEEFSETEIRPYMILQVHDSLLLEIPQELTESVTKKIKQIMENIYPLTVPLLVDCSIGQNWGEMEKQK